MHDESNIYLFAKVILIKLQNNTRSDFNAKNQVEVTWTSFFLFSSFNMMSYNIDDFSNVKGVTN